MCKFKIGDELTLNDFYYNETARLNIKAKQFTGVVTKIVGDVYLFGQADKKGNQVGFNEKYLKKFKLK